MWPKKFVFLSKALAFWLPLLSLSLTAAAEHGFNDPPDDCESLRVRALKRGVSGITSSCFGNCKPAGGKAAFFQGGLAASTEGGVCRSSRRAAKTA